MEGQEIAAIRHEEVLTAKEVARALKVSKPTAYEIIRNQGLREKKFHVIMAGTSYRIGAESFFKWIKGEVD